MENNVMYIVMSLACATFVIKTVIGWIRSARYEKDRSCRKAEQTGRYNALIESRLSSLEEELKKNSKSADIDPWFE